MNDNLSKILADLEGKGFEPNKIPPLEKWSPELSGDIDIRIDAEGRWFHEGDEIKRWPLIKLFSSILKKEEGSYYLVTPVEKWRITVEDVPFVISRVEFIEAEGQQGIVFYTSVDDRVIVDDEHPLRVEKQSEMDIRPYVMVRNGMEAVLSRPVYYQLVEVVVPGSEKEKAVHGVYSLGGFFPLE